MAAQHRPRGFVERPDRAVAGDGIRRTVGAGGRIEIVEMQGELVDRRGRQNDPGGLGMPRDLQTPVGWTDIHRSHRHAGFTPATRDSAAMKRAHSSRCAASTARPSSVMR